jgi:hypothetical protein
MEEEIKPKREKKPWEGRPPSKIYRDSTHVERLLMRKLKKLLDKDKGETVYMFVNTAIEKEIVARGYKVPASVAERLDTMRTKKQQNVINKKLKEQLKNEQSSI